MCGQEGEIAEIEHDGHPGGPIGVLFEARQLSCITTKREERILRFLATELELAQGTR